MNDFQAMVQTTDKEKLTTPPTREEKSGKNRTERVAMPTFIFVPNNKSEVWRSYFPDYNTRNPLLSMADRYTGQRILGVVVQEKVTLPSGANSAGKKGFSDQRQRKKRILRSELGQEKSKLGVVDSCSLTCPNTQYLYIIIFITATALCSPESALQFLLHCWNPGK